MRTTIISPGVKPRLVSSTGMENTCMNASILGLCLLMVTFASSGAAQERVTAPTNRTNTERELLNLSREKWRWMSERKVDSLALLFHDEAVFVHMGATMSKTQ